MINYKNKGLFLVVSGPSGVGKGTLCKRLINEEKDMYLSVSVTTREMRRGEKDGNDYHFVTKEKFKEMIKNNEFLEYAKVHDNYYGTLKTNINDFLDKGTNVILEIDINGALQVKERYQEAIFIFILPPSMEELERRLIERNTESKDKQLNRFKKAYLEINEFPKYNYVVANDEIEKALLKIKSIIAAEGCRVDRIEDLYLGSIEEIMHESLIDE